jgi:Mg/Co/Ni transporter MgtE
MDREPVAVPADLPATQALDEFFHRYRWDWFPVVDDSGRFLGLVRQQAVGTALPGQTVRDVVDSAGGPFDVEENASIEALLGSEQLRNLGALMAVDRDGVLRGVVTVEQLRRALQSAVAPGPA